MMFDAKLKKRVVTAGSVFGIALSIGFLMQNLSPVADRFIDGKAEKSAKVAPSVPKRTVQPLSSALKKRPVEPIEMPVEEEEASIVPHLTKDTIFNAAALPVDDSLQHQSETRSAPAKLAALLPGLPPIDDSAGFSASADQPAPQRPARH